MKLDHRVRHGQTISLDDIDPDDTGPFRENGPKVEAVLSRDQDRMVKLQQRLYAERKQSLLIVLQSMDTGGKDGVIKRVLISLDARGCHVTSWKAPNAEEAAHDFLWRIHRQCPERGNISIFNRSHYEDVLVPRVMKLSSKHEWSRRYEQINAFEKLLTDTGTTVVKIFLHISKDEQKKRLEARLADPEKRWKYDPSDAVARSNWDKYRRAYEDVFAETNTRWAPWHVVPANSKWYRDVAASSIIVSALEKMAPRIPETDLDWRAVKLD